MDFKSENITQSIKLQIKLPFSCQISLTEIFSVIFNIATKARGLAGHKTRFNPPLVLEMSCSYVRYMAIVILWFVSVRVTMSFVFVAFQCFCSFVVFLLWLMCFPPFWFVPDFFLSIDI